MLELKEIKDTIEAGQPDWILKAEKEYVKLQVHVNGVGTADYLTPIGGYENANQLALKKKVAMSNRFVTSNLLRPVDKVFSAKGGSRIYKTSGKSSEEKLTTKLNDVRGGYSIRKYIENIQANKFYSDPAGLVFFEWKDKETEPTQKPVTSIYNYQQNGRGVDWVIFKSFKKENTEGEFWRVVDDKFDYLIKDNGGQLTIIEDETFENPWGYVPAIINSDIISPSLKYNESPIWDIVDILDGYLNQNATKSIYGFLHSYPVFWAYVLPCKACDGTGLYEGNTCQVCGGAKHTFRKDVSDVIMLKVPQKDDPKLAPDVAGYVQPDLATWEQQRVELNWLFSLAEFTLWGSGRVESSENKTATAAFIDAQPVNDRLNNFADSFEGLENIMTDIIGQFYLGDAYKGSSINYGRRFLVEPPDVIWKKYETAKTTGAPKVSLDYLLTQFYQAEFSNDIESLVVAQKGVKLEPFVHKTDEQINLLPVNNKDKKAKFYFNEWFKTLDQDDILIKNVDALAKEFQKYLQTVEEDQPQNNQDAEV